MNTRDLILKNEAFKHLLTWGLDKKRISGIKIHCHGHSMSPFIRNGDTVVLNALDSGQRIQPGDIVVAVIRKKGTIVIHRVIRIRDSFVQIKGDNLTAPDGWFLQNDLLGVVSSVQERKIGPILNSPLFNRTVAALSRTGLLQAVLLPTLRSLRLKKKTAWKERR